MFACLLLSAFLVVMLASLCALQSRASHAADEPDLIFKRSTVFKWVTPNDKLATYGIDDPEVEGVACHFTVPEPSCVPQHPPSFRPSKWGYAPRARAGIQ